MCVLFYLMETNLLKLIINVISRASFTDAHRLPPVSLPPLIPSEGLLLKGETLTPIVITVQKRSPSLHPLSMLYIQLHTHAFPKYLKGFLFGPNWFSVGPLCYMVFTRSPLMYHCSRAMSPVQAYMKSRNVWWSTKGKWTCMFYKGYIVTLL